jgi:predicted metallopeptidase
MYYYIDNRPKFLSYLLLDEVLSFAQYYLGLEEEYIIRIVFEEDLAAGVLGYCDGEIDEEYVIEIKKQMTQKEMIATIFHELVHVKQMMDGMLGEDGSTWAGIHYDRKKIPYDSLPWEKHAHMLQNFMIEEFFSGKEEK